MVQGLSVGTLTISGNGAFHGSTSSWRRHFKLVKKTYLGIDGQCLWEQCVQNLHLRGKPNRLRQRNLRVEAGWLFKGGDQGLDSSSERSEAANEDILIFFFQLDLATRVQVLCTVFLISSLYIDIVKWFKISLPNSRIPLTSFDGWVSLNFSAL